MGTSSEIRLSDISVHAGALALLEDGELGSDGTGFDRILTPSNTRGPRADGDRWRGFFDRLRGYERTRALVTDLPVWIPIVELTPPEGGSATVSCQRSTHAERKASLTVFGSGFGNTVTASLDQAVEVTARDAPLEIAAQVRLTANEYRQRGSSPPLVRVDIVGVEPVTRVSEVDPRPALPTPPTPEYEIIDTVLLRTAVGSGSFTWRRRSAEQAGWNVALGPSINAIGLDLKLDVSVTQGQQFETTFEFPFGRDYHVYMHVGAPRLAPLCSAPPVL